MITPDDAKKFLEQIEKLNEEREERTLAPSEIMEKIKRLERVKLWLEMEGKK